MKLITLALVVPIVLIWFAGFVGLVNLRKYARRIKGSRDGKGFMYLAAGVTVLAITVAINSLLSRVMNYAAEQHMVSSTVATLTNVEFATFADLISFLLIFIGARHLVRLLKTRVKKTHLVTTTVLLVFISVPYILSVFLDPTRGLATISGSKVAYHIPDWLILLTIVVPYILTWAFGIFATLFLYTYNKHVKGHIYKASLRRLTRGFFIVLIITIVLQFLNAANSILASWGLGAIVSLVYVLLLVITYGFLCIARGAKNLTKLEDVT